jgi:Zn-dependent protease with chaperone function
VSAVALLAQPVANALSRSNEIEADRYSLETAK